MELRHLRAFCVVAQEMHVTRAAKRLRIAQPALTQQIRALEKSCGFPVLHADGRGIALTEAGTFLHGEAEAILVQLHNACLKGKEIARGKASHMQVGVTEGASYNPTLADVLSSLREDEPNLSLLFSQKQTPELVKDLRNGLIDVAFICPLTDPHGLTTHRLYLEDMLVAVPQSHSLGKQKTVSIRDIEAHPVVMISHGFTEHSLESRLTAACAKAGFSPRILQTVPEFMLALNLVAAGLGITFVPPYMRNIHSKNILYRPIQERGSIMIETVVAYRNESVSPHVFSLSRMAQERYARATSRPKSPAKRKPNDRRTKPNTRKVG